MATVDKITWNCQACGQPIADGHGYLNISRSTLRRVEEAWTEHERRNDGLMSLAELLALPAPVRWLPFHHLCDPDPTGDDTAYFISVERIRTPRQALWWTAHLMGKTWTEHTDWDQVIERLGEAA